MNDFHAGALGEDAVQAYERDGIICIRQAFDDAQVEFLRKIAAQVRTAVQKSATVAAG